MAKNSNKKTNPQSLICLPHEVEGFNRRQLLKTGACLTAYASVSKLFLSQKLLAQSSDSSSTSILPQRKLIWISLSGGCDNIEWTTPYTSSTSGVDMPYDYSLAQSVANSTDGSRVGRWLPNIAQIGRDLLIVRGLAMGTTSHTAGRTYMETAILSNGGQVNAASIPSIVASQSQDTIPLIQLDGGADPMIDRGLLNPVSVVRANNLDLYRSMYPTDSQQYDRKMAMLAHLRTSLARTQADLADQGVSTVDRIQALEAAESKVRVQFENNVGSKLALSDADRSAFMAGAPQGVRASGALNAAALALKLIREDLVTCVNIGMGGFDTHQNQATRLQPTLTSLDFMVGQLVAGLKESNLFDQTLIVLYTDFGRTPLINQGNGRDHWPVGSAMIIGGGLDGGRAVGGFDSNHMGVGTDPDAGGATNGTGSVQLNPTHVAGAVLQLTLGADYLQYRPYLQALPTMVALR